MTGSVLGPGPRQGAIVPPGHDPCVGGRVLPQPAIGLSIVIDERAILEQDKQWPPQPMLIDAEDLCLRMQDLVTLIRSCPN